MSRYRLCLELKPYHVDGELLGFVQDQLIVTTPANEERVRKSFLGRVVTSKEEMTEFLTILEESIYLSAGYI